MKSTSNIFHHLSKITDIDNLILSKFSKFSNNEIESLETISSQLANLSKNSKINLHQTLDFLIKINDINSSITPKLITQLVKLSEYDSKNFEIILTNITKSIQNFPNIASQIVDGISDGQLQSKWWLVDQIETFNLGKIFMCAGWFATLLLDDKLKFKQCINIDSDPDCEKVSKILHKKHLIDNWKFQAVTEDIHNIDYNENKFQFLRFDGSTCEVNVVPDTIINTSCEHINNFDIWYKKIPKGKLLILQSNNGIDIKDHINCVSTLEDFKKQTPMEIELFSGEKEMPKFTRFMRIGYK